ncbi:energy transducer TonB [Sulfurimonas marina]|uniref:TonB C-terminal domain-containing protein n=1 Tax=Sulfurimonas marina TaxID=2590551 RepID=A0A7M1AVT2_9BACT|nr:energy transducer TonB [Sulfurimonas marina]QOP41525.1 hypothetical protein FJR03_07115 [Sulfurimonas marina]
MNRYISSFAMTIVIYTSLVASIIYMAEKQYEASESKESIDNTKIVVVSLMREHPCTEQKQLKKVEKKPKKEVQKKVVKKEKLKPKVEQKAVVEKIVQKEVVKEKIIEKEVIIEEIVAEVEEEVVEQQVEDIKAQEEEELREQKLQEMLAAKQKELDSFTLQLVQKINENKRYPLSARRRGVEGDVDVKFIVLADGGVSAIKVIAGKSIFKKATIQAIEESFPLNVEKSLIDFPKEFNIKLAYTLK